MSLQVTPYLIMDGNAKEAIQFYEKALDAKPMFLSTYEEMPENPEFPMPEEAKGLVAHAMVKIGDSDLMFSDTFPGHPVVQGNQVTICITTKDKDRSQQIFDALQQDGKVSMPLQETSFSPAYGMVTDKFGVTFHIYTEGQQ
ncbi:VOC family protein [Brevibacillus migulae]|uniref:VOC family protein n=1 Tax=Brevibacillus migulae TaxID=1644114 RepID=UPI00106E8C56|nr:VOC family protein [Brevibacillus migulae]